MMMTHRKFVFVLAVLGVSVLALQHGCAPSAPPVVPTVTGDAHASTCADACARLRELHCPEGDPLPTGESCSAFCDRVDATSFLRVDVACIVHASTRAALVPCNVRCRE